MQSSFANRCSNAGSVCSWSGLRCNEGTLDVTCNEIVIGNAKKLENKCNQYRNRTPKSSGLHHALEILQRLLPHLTNAIKDRFVDLLL